MKRILINATQNEEIRVALCKGNHLYDFDLENRTREQKKSNIYKGHVTRVEPSLEAVFVEYGSQRQGFLPIREISSEYLSGNPRDENIKKLIKEGDELIVQVEKEERGNKGAALSTYVSLAGRYLVLMPNNPRGGGISRQISGKLREDMKRMLGNLDLAKGMSVIIRTAGIGKTQEDLQHDLNHLLNIWQAIQEQNQKYPSPRLVHQEAGVVTRAVRDYLRDDIAEIWIDNENAYIEAAGFIDAVMPTQAEKLRKYTDYEPMFSRFNIEKQIETAYQREVRLPSGGSIVIDQTEALVSIDINSAKSTKGSDVAETAYHTNLEAADEIARQLRLRDMGGLIVIDFIDMNDNKHQKEVEKRLVDATKYDRARVQFGEISKFGLMEMSRQRLRPSLEESTGYICPRCHGNGMIRDLRSLSLSIMRQIEQIALKERQGEVQAEVPTDIAAFLLNEKRDSLVYLEQDSGTRITILPHAHLESPNFKLHFNRDGFAPSSYERITDAQQQEHSGLGYDVDWQTAEKERPEQQPTRQPRKVSDTQSSDTDKRSSNQQNSTSVNNNNDNRSHNSTSKNAHAPTSSTRAPQNNNNQSSSNQGSSNQGSNNQGSNNQSSNAQDNTAPSNQSQSSQPQQTQPAPVPVAAPSASIDQPQAVAWLSNLFAQAPQAQTSHSVSSRDAAEAIEAIVNTGAQSLGSFGQVDNNALSSAPIPSAAQTSHQDDDNQSNNQQTENNTNRQQSSRHTDNNTNTSTNSNIDDDNKGDDRRRRKPRKSRASKPHQRKDQRDEADNVDSSNATNSSSVDNSSTEATDVKQSDSQDKRDDNRRPSDRSRNRQNNERNNNERNNTDRDDSNRNSTDRQDSSTSEEQTRAKRKPNSQRSSRGTLERGETLTEHDNAQQNRQQTTTNNSKPQANTRRNQNPNEVMLQVNEASAKLKSPEVVHLSLDDSKSEQLTTKPTEKQTAEQAVPKSNVSKNGKEDITNQQSVVEQSTDKQGEDKRKSITSTPADTTPVNVIEDKAQSSVETATIDDSQPTVDELPISETSTESQKPVEAIADPVQTVPETQDVSTDNSNITEAAETTDSGDKGDSNGVVDTVVNSVTDSNAALELTHEALFASRYVTATKFGQASNDPRLVRRQQAQLLVTPKVQANEQTIKSVPAIRGTVGEFIHATLTDAQSHLANSGVIGSFIAAMTAYSQQLSATEQANTESNIAEDDIANNADKNALSNSSFDFSNYGYQPLAVDYLARFEAMTQAVSQFAAAQGKTSVEPRAISKRASNDPRGQHPDYRQPEQEQAVLTVPSESEQLNQSDKDPSETVIASPTSVQAEVVAEASLVVDEPNQVDEHGQFDAHNVQATALTGQVQADDISAESEHLLQADQAYLDNAKLDEPAPTDIEAMKEELAKEDSQANKSKTTIASYKNMIENVAEQLSPQTGMFNLTTPKVPKARSRKPKTEHKKPTQAEKLETDNSDSDS
ncbi:Rne/Rng family ribonuclease [Psychrobacter sp. CAL346-MNA-CIBAN-0220]|uniref:Rne/Rng family ribonuclease n=1 Tax=Psychrobacter sp. CAL346-MNA-CIBAN-0220 TaxID=3140457 RepID=UPI003333EEED